MSKAEGKVKEDENSLGTLRSGQDQVRDLGVSSFSGAERLEAKPEGTEDGVRGT